MKAKVKVGDPIILIDSTGFEGQGLYDGMKGWANSVATVDQTYVFFMPQDGKEMYVTPASRVEVDEEDVSLIHCSYTISQAFHTII